MDVTLPPEVVQELAELLAPVDPSAPLEESTQVKRLTGSVMLRGFTQEGLNSSGSSIRFNVRALKVGQHVRLIIDVNLGTGQGMSG